MIRWDKGGDASVGALDADRVTLVSSTPSAPGSRIDGALGSGSRLRVKVHGCRRRDDGRFVLEGRLLDASRALRAELAALVPPLEGAG